MSYSYDEGRLNGAGLSWTCTVNSASQSYSNYTPKAAVSVFGGQEDTLGVLAADTASPDFGAVYSVTAGANGAVVRVKSVRIKLYYKLDIGADGYDSRRPNALSDVAIGRGHMVIVGVKGTVLRSTDNGQTWNAVDSGLGVDLWKVRWMGTHYVATGDRGLVAESTDGATWTARNSGTTMSLRALSRSLRAGYMVAGTSGAMLSSPDLKNWRTLL